MFQLMEYCGINPTGTQNDFPFHGRRALHSRVKHRKYRHTHRLQYPLLLKYGYFYPASVRHVQGSTQLQEKPVRFLQDMRVCGLRLPVFQVLQMLHNYRCCNKYLYYSFHTCRVLYCGTRFVPVFRLPFFLSVCFLPACFHSPFLHIMRLLLRRLRLQMQHPVLIFLP